MGEEWFNRGKENGRNQVRTYLAGAMLRASEGLDKNWMSLYLKRKAA